MDLTPALCLTLLLGCSDAPTPVALQEWQAIEEWTLGSEQDPRFQFHQITGLARDTLGRLYVADGGAGVIRVYNGSAQHLKDIGRPGEGPGEFRGLLGIGFIADTLYAIDGRAQSVALFDHSGEYLRSASVERMIGGPGTVSRLLPGGRAALIPSVPMETQGRIPRLIAATDGSRLDTLDYIVAGEGALTLRAGSGQMSIRDPFAQPRFLPLHPSGEWWIEVAQYPDAPHAPGEFALRRRTIRGEIIWERTFSQEPVSFAESVDHIADSIIRTSRLAIPEAELRRALRPPSHHFALDRVIVTPNGDIWLRTRTSAGNSWLILDEAGEPMARLQLPDGAAPREIVGRESVVAVQTNKLGVQTITSFRLRH